MLADRVAHLSQAVQVFDPQRMRDTALGESLRQPGLGAESASRGSALYIGIPRLSARSRSSEV